MVFPAMERLIRSYVLPAVLISSLSFSASAREEERGSKSSLEQAVCSDAKECFERGKEEFERRNYVHAEELFAQALSLSSPGKSRVIMLYNLGSSCLLGDKAERAADYFKLYLSEDLEQVHQEMPAAPSPEDIHSLLLGISLYQEGEEFYSRGFFAESIVMYRRAQQHFAQHQELELSIQAAKSMHLPLARAYDAAGNYAKAHQEYNLYLGQALASAEYPAIEQRITELENILRLPPDKNIPGVSEPGRHSPESSASFFQRHLWSTLTAGGAAVFGAGALAVRSSATAEYQELRRRCTGNSDCSAADADPVRRKDRIAAIFGISSLAALAAAGVIYYLELPAANSRATAEGVQLEAEF